MLLYVHRDHKDCYGRGPQDNHPDLHTAPELCAKVPFRLVQCCFTSTETMGTIRDGESKAATSEIRQQAYKVGTVGVHIAGTGKELLPLILSQYLQCEIWTTEWFSFYRWFFPSTCNVKYGQLSGSASTVDSFPVPAMCTPTVPIL